MLTWPDNLIGTERKDVVDPIVGAWFRMEKGPESTPPTYEYDEFGVVIEGIEVSLWSLRWSPTDYGI